ncbi:DUF6114 domain-containing protein [Micromonospora humida]|uniref:DUF6114 domain-containing protein n=1 Tax=Micromonospora humida TaxID=2809018 RepID=UPI0034441D05
MTRAQPPYAPTGPGRGWRSFRRWRRSRPFWGGLLTVLAGVEMFASTRMTLNGLSFSSGATGLYSLLIPIILVTCGLLLWVSPGQRLFYSIVAAVTTVYSLMGLNLGGFFLGLLLGLVGSALGFAWTPIRPATPPAADTAAPSAAGAHPDADPGADDGFDADGRLGFFGGPVTDTTAPRDPAQDPAGGRDPRHLGVALLVLGLAAGALVAAAPKPVRAAAPGPVRAAAPGPVRAAAPKPAPTACPRPAPTGTAAPRPTAGRTATPSATPGTASPSPSPSPDGNLLTDLLHGLGDLFTGGGKTEPAVTPSPDRTPSPGAGATPKAAPTPRPKPTFTGARCTPGRPARPGTVRPGRPLPRIAPEPGQPRVARQPSKLTGTRVTMTGLRFEGIVDLPTSDGTLKALKFSMSRAVTADFSLVADGPAGRHQRYVTDELTVRGDVAFYATRFVGKLLGITVTLTPDLPFPDGIPVTSPIPITFTDPAIDLAFVDSDTLTARPALALSLS